MSAASTSPAPRVDIYTRVTNRIVEQLEQGIHPWNAEHASGRITRPLRSNGQPHKGINILQLWASSARFFLSFSLVAL